MRVLDKFRTEGDGEYVFHCPGCKGGHVIREKGTTRPGASWTFNGSLEKPTFSPSYLTGTDNFTVRRCHSYIEDGMIRFLSDCWHELRGKTVPMVDMENF